MKWNMSSLLFLGFLFLLVPFLAASDDTPSLSAETPTLIPEERSNDGSSENPDSDEEGDAEEESVTAESVTKEIENAIQENSADDLLNLATEIKLSADTILDLTKAIAYCTEAEKKGLSGESAEYCHQLKISSQLERGLAMAKIFMNDTVQPEDLRGNWQVVRMMALDDLESFVNENPDLAIAQLAVGRLQMFPGGNTDKAKASLDAAIQSAEEEPDILVEGLKFRSILEEDAKKSGELLERGLTIDPGDPELQYLLAAHLADMYQEERGLELIDKALETVPLEKRYIRTKAAILAKLGQKEEALKLFNTTVENSAAEDDDEKFTEEVQRGEFLASIGFYEEAVSIYSRLINEKPIFALFYLRAAAYFQLKDYTNGLKDVNKAIGLDPTFSEAIRLKALIYIQQERYSDAIPLLEKICIFDGNNEDITAQLAYTLAQNDKFTEGIERIDTLLETNPNSVPLLRGKADIYLMYGRWNDAIMLYDKILEGNPDDSGVLNNYAWVLATSPEDSVRNGTKALELALRAAEKTNYRESYILSTLAASYAETGDFEKAKEWSEKAVSLAEKEKEERLDDLKHEFESYQKEEPWREAQQKAGDASDPLPPEAVDFF